ncbi:serine hydrolase [bacterium]|nr:serine hydrolase [bacterium]
MFNLKIMGRINTVPYVTEKSKAIFRMILLLTSCFLLLSCNDHHYISYSPEDIGDGWETGSIHSVLNTNNNFESKDFAKIIEKNHFKNIHSILIVKNGVLLFESYFHGYTREKEHDLRSSTKSLLSLLVGIAQDNKLLNINNPIQTYLPEHQKSVLWSEKKKLISIEHLLLMKSGLDSDDWNKNSPGFELKMYKSKDWSQFILKQAVTADPGKSFRYSTGGTVLLGRVLSNAVQESIPSYSKKVLFDPLEIRDPQWQKTPSNQTDTGGHLYLKPRDMAKIGQIVLDKGRWKNKQIVSQQWIENSTKPRTIIPKQEHLELSYSYLWWHHDFVVNNKRVKSTIAWGNGGQFIFIIPDLDMVTVFTGGNYNSVRTLQPFEILEKNILPLFASTL